MNQSRATNRFAIASSTETHVGFIIKEIGPGDLTYYQTLEAAAAALEPIDVEQGEYKGFDETGRELTIETDGEEVRITLSKDNPSQACELKSSLIKEILSYGHHGPRFAVDRQWAEDASMEELIARWQALHTAWGAQSKGAPVRRAFERIMRVFGSR
jgi:hypothetical protein